jgi:hypothetical protein
MKTMLLAAAIAFSVGVSSCNYQPPQSLAGVLAGGEWTCIQSIGADFSGETRFVWARDGRWSQRSSIEFTDSGDSVSFDALVGGEYRIEGDTISMKGDYASVLKVTRNGTPQALPEHERTRIERGVLLVYDGDPHEISHWDANSVMLKDGDEEVACIR